MLSCPRCGAETVPSYHFCTACGQPLPAAWHYPSQPRYPAPRKDNTVAIVVAVVFVILAVSVIVAAALYGMSSGLVTPNPTKPTVTLIVLSSSGSGADILVAGAQPAEAPSRFKINLQLLGDIGVAHTLPLSPGASAIIVVGGGAYLVTWQNPGGSGQVSPGDHLVVTYPAGASVPPAGSNITLYLIWSSDGSIVAQVSFTVPTMVPTVSLVVTSKSASNATILVTGIQPPTSPGHLVVNMENVTSSTFGAVSPAPIVAGGLGIGSTATVTVTGVTFTVSWFNPGGTGLVSGGDVFGLTYQAPLGTQWAFLLLWEDGSTLASASWQV